MPRRSIVSHSAIARAIGLETIIFPETTGWCLRALLVPLRFCWVHSNTAKAARHSRVGGQELRFGQLREAAAQTEKFVERSGLHDTPGVED